MVIAATTGSSAKVPDVIAVKASEYPRLLVISQEIPQSVNAGSILLQRMLKDYPPGKLLIVGPRPVPGAKLLPCIYRVFAPRMDRLLRTRLSSCVEVLFSFGVSIEGLERQIIAEAESFGPEVILTVFQGYSFYSAAFRFASKRNIPIVLVCYDDPQGFARTPTIFRRFENRRDRALYRAAAKRLAISPEMATEFARRYGVGSSVIYPVRSEGIIPRPLDEANNLKAPGCLTVGYTGTLAYGYGPQLETMLPAFEEANVFLRVYAPAPPTWRSSKYWKYEGYYESDVAWRKVKSECDAVILPYCWPELGHEILYRTHFPSKLPEYLALGMPVIIVGPCFATGVRWGMRHPAAALTITTNLQEEFCRAFRRLRQDAALRRSLSIGAVVAAAADFDVAKLRTEFVAEIISAAGSSCR